MGAADLFLIATNSTLTSEGKLVIGAGITKQARDRFPGLDAVLGKCIRELHKQDRRYGLLISEQRTLGSAAKLGCFQTKRDWRDLSRLADIKQAISLLSTWTTMHKSAQVALNCPGVGHGGLTLDSWITPA